MTAGVYLHIPFCKSRCSYCDFATDIYRSSDAVERYVEALCLELSRNSLPVLGGVAAASADGVVLRKERHLVDTIYFGGGTPSLLSPEQVKKTLEAVRERFELLSSPEVTMEMNPATVTRQTLTDYRSLGVNRASFGVQTFNNSALKLLARGHDANDARETFNMLRDAGFDNVSFDLIAGLPRQTIADWKRNLDEALQMNPEHMSLYLLEVHEATPLAEQIRSGRRPMPDEDVAAEMYELMVDTLTAAGYVQYEISNFAKPGRESRHNLKYWRLDPVYGFGVSAHSFDGVERYANDRDTAKYVELIESGVGTEVSRQKVNAGSEFAFLALRLTTGIDLIEYRERFGVDLVAKYGIDLPRLENEGLIVIDGGRLVLTRRGMLFSNEVFSVFV